MSKAITQIDRQGTVIFGDAEIYVREEGLAGTWQERDAWEAEFKRVVFKRILQQLNRMGWKCKVPDIDAQDILSYGYKISAASARSKRLCQKGNLHADLDISGRCIKFEMFQNLNAPDRPDHGGRYQSDKERHMPYVMRLEMERTRRHIRKYLCNVFSGYKFEAKRHDGRSARLGVDGLTALQFIQGCYETSSHFKGDPATMSDYDREHNSQSAEGETIKHGQRVWYADYQGRICTGIAYYNINNMWWVASGRYGVSNISSFSIYTKIPENPRIKRNERQSRRRLECLLSEAVKLMDFKRAEVLKNILFKPNEPLFVLWNEEHQLYHRSGFSGYTRDTVYAGKFTQDELKRWGNDSINKIMPLQEAS
ncbi:hypothetical protein LLS47_12210 [Rouxiella badensis]|uniref:hypothetical protein n=1 Tax=Rouxiella badensis TaxID=1646377 RepID=UPI001D1592FE|nr:hypothetical protein [Rouxiella badensis]MCC3733691.1 hypothetical protein [Rouxiella badensis]MCC3759655.1 hypothetical protein [Rouxiella badensis]